MNISILGLVLKLTILSGVMPSNSAPLVTLLGFSVVSWRSQCEDDKHLMNNEEPRAGPTEKCSAGKF